MTSLEEIDELQSDLNDTRAAFLRERGWKHTSNTPGFLWLWEKTIDGTRYALPVEQALFAERYYESTPVTRST